MAPIVETTAPVAARPRSSRSRIPASGKQARRVVEEEAGEHRQRDHLEDAEVDEEREHLRDEERGGVDRREPDRVEAALVALGDEQAVDREERGEQDRHQQDAGGEAALERGPVEPEAEDHERRDGEERHRGQRLERAELDPQVLRQDHPDRAHPGRPA